MSQFDVKMTALADAIKAKNTSVTGKLSVDAMTAAVDGIVINPPSGGGVDVSGVTATAADVLAGKQFVNADGELVDGEIQSSTQRTSSNVVTISPGYVGEEKKVTVGTALPQTRYTPTGATQIIIKPNFFTTGVQMIEGEPSLQPTNIRAGKTIYGKTGLFTANATATAADIVAGKTAGINGEMVTGTLEISGGGSVDLSFITAEVGDIRSGKVGADANGNPVYGTLEPGSTFYLCTGYDGVFERMHLDGVIEEPEYGDRLDLDKDFQIVDPSAVGTARRWKAKLTFGPTATIGCIDVETDSGEYEKRWAIYPGDNADEWSCWVMATTGGAETPMQTGLVWQAVNCTIIEPVVFPRDPEDGEDEAPYGPTGWKGYRLAQDGVTGFWSRTNEYREGMTFSFFTPELGKVYSEDTSIACTALYSEADAHLVALYHFDENHEDAVGNTSAKLYEKSVEGGGKFAGCLYGDTYNATQHDSSYYMEISGLPEMDAFTIEWWQKDERDYGDGGVFMWQPEADGKARSTFLTVAIPKGDSRYIAGRWKHLAFVREAGSSTVTQYLDGKNVGTVEYADVLGGRTVNFIGLSPTTTQAKAVKIDELAIYAAAKYNDDFYPQDSPIIN